MAKFQRNVTLKDGFYLEVRNNASDRGIKIRRNNKDDLLRVMEQYKKTKDVEYLGEVRDGSFV